MYSDNTWWIHSVSFSLSLSLPLIISLCLLARAHQPHTTKAPSYADTVFRTTLEHEDSDDSTRHSHLS